MNIREIEHMWKVASNNPNHDTNWHDPVVMAFAKLVAQHEREACASIAEEESMRGLPDEQPKGEHLKMAVAQIVCGTFIADAIRARGNT